jgi:CTP synthase
VTLTKDHNITTGKIYAQVINRERKGDYLGKTVQVVPHITDAIQDWIERVAQVVVDNKAGSSANSNRHNPNSGMPEVCLIELGGTVGDIESMIFLEALRQFRFRVGGDNFCHVHVSLVPVVGAVGEPKSKPTQHGVKELRAAGLSPDIIICRSSSPLNRSVVGKISQFCMVPSSHVISVHDVTNIYRVPLLLLEQRVPGLVLNTLRINKMPSEDLPQWRHIAAAMDSTTARHVKIGIVGKYTGLSDSYLSITKSLDHAGAACGVKIDLVWLDSSQLEDSYKGKKPEIYASAWKELQQLDGILIPGGFGDRGVEGKLLAIQWARENKVPFFGICLGMQASVIEFARNVVKLSGATSAEFDQEAEHPVIIYMPEISTTHMGGTMRLGARTSFLKDDTLAIQLYNGERLVNERHRHRYEVNPHYIQQLSAAGLVFSGTDEKQIRMECIELPSEVHPFFFGVQYHPEFTSRPLSPNPIFLGFVQAAAKQFTRKSVSFGAPNSAKRSSQASPIGGQSATNGSNNSGNNSPGQKTAAGKFAPITPPKSESESKQQEKTQRA